MFKIIIKRSISIIGFILVFLLIKKGFEFILIDDASSRQRVVMHNLYTDNINYDTILLGSSHGYSGFDAEYMSTELGISALNLSSPGQTLDSSYVLLKEADKYNDVNQVYLELYHWIGQQEAYDDRTDLVYQYNVSDYMRPSVDKYYYMLNMCDKSYYSTALIPARRYWRDLFNPSVIESNVKNKINGDYFTYYKDNPKFSVLGPSDGCATDSMFLDYTEFSHIDRADFNDDWLQSLKDIIMYCDKNDIKLTLVVMPITDMTMVGVENYDEYIDMVNEIVGDCTGCEVDYIDFNLIKEDYFIGNFDNFSDNNHLNIQGRSLIMSIFVQLEKGELLPSEVFYQTYSEKLSNMREELFWVYAKPVEGDIHGGTRRIHESFYGQDMDGDGLIEYKINPISTLEDAEYSYSVTRYSEYIDTEKNQTFVMQDKDSNDVLFIPEGEHGKLEITAYTEKDGESESITIIQAY